MRGERRRAKRGAARLEASLQQLPEVIDTKKRRGSKDAETRVSTTDPDARVMKIGDGGFRPAFNAQFSTTTDRARVSVGVDVTSGGCDIADASNFVIEPAD
ncbi:MAG: hypothetical protein HOP15_13375 [Planctomycetes bacterium]|nr:hypothetical protein [Planctomycetota bacterium]